MTDTETQAARATAEAAYKQLLFGPMPMTTVDYRRAVMMAVLIGQVMAATGDGQPAQTKESITPASLQPTGSE